MRGPAVTAASWPPWFGPAPVVDPDVSTVLVTVGGDRPVVRIPDGLALPVLKRLLAHAADRALLGPVLHHPRSGATYWWVQRGATPDYPTDCRLLANRTAIPVPAPGSRPCTVAEWLHMPERQRLTGPAWLAGALQVQEALVAEEAQTAARAAQLDAMEWAPGRCNYCPAGTDEALVVKGDPDRGCEGIFCRFHLQLTLAVNEHHRQRQAATRALNERLDAHRRTLPAGRGAEDPSAGRGTIERAAT